MLESFINKVAEQMLNGSNFSKKGLNCWCFSVNITTSGRFFLKLNCMHILTYIPFMNYFESINSREG